MCTINDNHIMYGSRHMECNRDHFCHFGPFLPFYHPNNPKNQNSEKMKKTPGDIIILHMCTINDNHITGVDTGCFQHWYTDFGHTNFGMPKSNLK